jgi:hypothetical protein
MELARSICIGGIMPRGRKKAVQEETLAQVADPPISVYIVRGESGSIDAYDDINEIEPGTAVEVYTYRATIQTETTFKESV